MRGSPLLHCLIGAIAFALFAIPLVRLTFAQANVPPANLRSANTAEDPGARHTLIRVHLAHPPLSLSLKLGAIDLLPASRSPLGSLVEIESSLPLAKDGIELALSAKWPDNTPDTAITVELEPDGLDVRQETRWSSGPALNDILSFKW